MTAKHACAPRQSSPTVNAIVIDFIRYCHCERRITNFPALQSDNMAWHNFLGSVFINLESESSELLAELSCFALGHNETASAKIMEAHEVLSFHGVFDDNGTRWILSNPKIGAPSWTMPNTVKARMFELATQFPGFFLHRVS